MNFIPFLNMEYYNIIKSSLIASNMPQTLKQAIEIKDKKRKYSKMTREKQYQLRKLVKVDGISINRASELIGIPRSTGKSLMKKINQLEQLHLEESNTSNQNTENINAHINYIKPQTEFIHYFRQDFYVPPFPTISYNNYYPMMIFIPNQYS